MVKRIDKTAGILSTLKVLRDSINNPEPQLKFRESALNEKVGDITIDTVKAFDTEMWETGIERMSIEGKWIIVEQYETKEQAAEGHNKWVELMKEKPKMKLKDINLWNLKL